MTETRSVAEECEDILIEILVRVPARPLVRFKCVSKRWLSLISDPTFCRRHARRNPRPNTSAFFAPNSGAFRISSNHHEVITCDPLKFVDIDIEIVQSCNGLLLCRLRDPDSGCPTTASSLVYYVVNPTTNEFRSLTPPAAAAAAESPYRIFGYGLAFDPSISPHYKVFFLWLVYEPIVAYEVLDHRVEIFSSETQTWRLLDSIFVARPYVNYRLCTYHNGALHWAGRDCEISYYHVDEDRLGYVDGLPEYIYRRYFLPLRYFRESLDGTHLHLIDIYRTGKIGGGRCLATFQVLEMEKDYSGWSVKYNVDLDPLRTTYPSFLKDNFTVMSFAAAADDQLLLCSPGKVIVYNIRNNTFKSTQVIGTNACVLSFFFVKSRTNFHYTESLAVVE